MPRWKKIGPLILWSIGFIYFFAMVVIPLWGWDWRYAQSVWDRWQSLNTGILALVAALWTLRILRAQIQQTSSHFDTERQAKERAATSVLSGALSEVVEYARQSAATISQMLAAPDEMEIGETGNREPFHVPVLSVEVITTIKECIEFAREEEAAKALSRILKWYQVQRSRLISLCADVNYPKRANKFRITLPFQISEHQLDAAIVHASAEVLFEFARSDGMLPVQNLTVDDVIRALALCDAPDVYSPAIHDRAEEKLKEYNDLLHKQYEAFQE